MAVSSLSGVWELEREERSGEKGEVIIPRERSEVLRVGDGMKDARFGWHK
jgi:hypothetical protein